MSVFFKMKIFHLDVVQMSSQGVESRQWNSSLKMFSSREPKNDSASKMSTTILIEFTCITSKYVIFHEKALTFIIRVMTENYYICLLLTAHSTFSQKVWLYGGYNSTQQNDNFDHQLCIYSGTICWWMRGDYLLTNLLWTIMNDRNVGVPGHVNQVKSQIIFNGGKTQTFFRRY